MEVADSWKQQSNCNMAHHIYPIFVFTAMITSELTKSPAISLILFILQCNDKIAAEN
jgi:hypothetical protein